MVVKFTFIWMSEEEVKKVINAIYEAVKSIAIEPLTAEKRKGIIGEDITIVKPREVIIKARQFMVGGRGDVADLLRYLKELRDRGVLSEEEYQEKVKKFLEKT
jgi:hypothetical protein